MNKKKQIYYALGGFIFGVLTVSLIWLCVSLKKSSETSVDSNNNQSDSLNNSVEQPTNLPDVVPTNTTDNEPDNDSHANNNTVQPTDSPDVVPTNIPDSEPDNDNHTNDTVQPTDPPDVVPTNIPDNDNHTNNNTVQPTDSPNVVPTDPPSVVPTDMPDNETDNNSNSSESSVALWDKSAVYLGGDIVSYNGRQYRAKWWTQGEKLDSSDVWEDLQIVDGTPAKPEGVDNTPVDASAPQNTELTDFKVVGYYPSWKPNKLSSVDFSIVTHVCYAFAIPTSDGSLRDLENPETAKTLIESAHANGAKVLLSIGGWSYNDTPLENVFMEATSDKAKTERFAKNIFSMCKKYGFDGIDMDWEHPRADGTSAKQYETLMLILSEKLHADNKLLTAAVLSGATADGNIYYDAAAHTNAVLNAVDFINIMAYDGGDGDRHSQYEFAVNCGTYWKETRGLPAYKVVLGVPFYARPSWADYGTIIESVPNAYSKDHTAYNGMEVYYNGVDTIAKKTTYAKENLGGIMIWELTQDTNDTDKSLLQTIGKNIS